MSDAETICELAKATVEEGDNESFQVLCDLLESLDDPRLDSLLPERSPGSVTVLNTVRTIFEMAGWQADPSYGRFIQVRMSSDLAEQILSFGTDIFVVRNDPNFERASLDARRKLSDVRTPPIEGDYEIMADDRVVFLVPGNSVAFNFWLRSSDPRSYEVEDLSELVNVEPSEDDIRRIIEIQKMLLQIERDLLSYLETVERGIGRRILGT